MSSPDLFVVCKSCGSEVSPYVTECPYCGTRLRKRAPKIQREGGVPKPQKPSRFGRTNTKPAVPRLSRLRANEIPGIRAERTEKPWATIVLVGLSLGVFLALSFVGYLELALIDLSGDPWRYVTAPFVNTGTMAQLAAVVGVGLFGWLLERRRGPVFVVVLFFLCGVGGLAAAKAIGTDGALYGTQGASLGLLAVYALPELIRRRRGADDETDLLGVAVIAVVLLLIPWGLGTSVLAGAVGGLIGAAVAGLLIAVKR